MNLWPDGRPSRLPPALHPQFPPPEPPRLAGAFHVGAGRACACPAVGLWMPQPCTVSQPRGGLHSTLTPRSPLPHSACCGLYSRSSGNISAARPVVWVSPRGVPDAHPRPVPGCPGADLSKLCPRPRRAVPTDSHHQHPGRVASSPPPPDSVQACPRRQRDSAEHHVLGSWGRSRRRAVTLTLRGKAEPRESGWRAGRAGAGQRLYSIRGGREGLAGGSEQSAGAGGTALRRAGGRPPGGRCGAEEQQGGPVDGGGGESVRPAGPACPGTGGL